MINLLINTITKIVKSKMFKRAIIKVIFVDVWELMKDCLTDFL